MTRNIKTGDTARFPYCSLYDVNTADNLVAHEEIDRLLSIVDAPFEACVKAQLDITKEEYMAEDVEYALRAVHRERQYNG